jgi:hypothetical protein
MNCPPSGSFLRWSCKLIVRTCFVLEVLRAGLSSYGPPEEIVTDNGALYVTSRGNSAFSREPVCQTAGACLPWGGRQVTMNRSGFRMFESKAACGLRIGQGLP